MQALCQLEVQDDRFLAEVPRWLADSDANQATITYAQALIERAWRERPVTAAELDRHAGDWPVTRMARVDRNVLRVALAELDQGDAPPKVILDEAVKIADAFGGHESARFVNGVLDAVWKSQRGE